MVAAYILINTTPGTLPGIVKEAINIDGVRTIDAVSGPYDAIALIEAPNNNALGKLVLQDIQTISGITKTLTCLVVSMEEKAAA